jgi:hypothetical protein
VQDVVQQGVAYIYARHADALDLTGIYDPAVHTITGPSGDVTVPGYDLVQTPRDFVYAFDEVNRRLDPRYYAGAGGTTLNPSSQLQLTGTDSVTTTSAPILQLGTPGTKGVTAAWVSVTGNVLSINDGTNPTVTYDVVTYQTPADLRAAILADAVCTCLLLSPTGQQPLVLDDLVQTAFP